MSVWATTTVRHGTPSGWRLHQELGERPCDPCYQAKSEYAAAAQARALKQLRHNHSDEYRQLYAQAKADIARERGEV